MSQRTWPHFNREVSSLSWQHVLYVCQLLHLKGQKYRYLKSYAQNKWKILPASLIAFQFSLKIVLGAQWCFRGKQLPPSNPSIIRIPLTPTYFNFWIHIQIKAMFYIANYDFHIFIGSIIPVCQNGQTYNHKRQGAVLSGNFVYS